MIPFTKDLIQRTIKYFREDYNHHIDEETASQYLESLAEVFGACRMMLQEELQRDQDTARGAELGKFERA